MKYKHILAAREARLWIKGGFTVCVFIMYVDSQYPNLKYDIKKYADKKVNKIKTRVKNIKTNIVK